VRGPEGQLAGSGIALLDAVRHLHAIGVPLARALDAATAVPARTCGRPELADLAPGTPADVVVLGDDLTVSRVLVAGR
jgi:N-acetylglucosamine-6-phosphate deacetylase